MTILITPDYTVNTTTKQFTDLKVPEIEYQITSEGVHLLSKGQSYRKVMMKGFIKRK